MRARHQLRSCHDDLRRELAEALDGGPVDTPAAGEAASDGSVDGLPARLLAHLDAERSHLYPLADRLVPNGRAVLHVLVHHDEQLTAWVTAHLVAPDEGPTGAAVDPTAVLGAFDAHVGLVDQLVVGIAASEEAPLLDPVIRSICGPSVPPSTPVPAAAGR